MNTESADLQPTRPRDRLLHMDVLRGFALLGILLVNFQFFTNPIQTVVIGMDSDLSGIDRAADWLVKALAEGKFYALFSMLFGAGFALTAKRALEAGRGFRGLYLRRLAVLAVFGLMHFLLVWSGDILLIYSIMGFLMMLLFGRTPRQRLPKWGIFFIAAPALLVALMSMSIEASKFDEEVHAGVIAGLQEEARVVSAEVEQASAAYSAGSYADAVRQRITDLGFIFGSAVWWMPAIFGYFLIGRWLLVSGRLCDPAAHTASLKRFLRWGFLAGLPMCLAATHLVYGLGFLDMGARLGLGYLLMAAGAVLLALGYLAVITLNAERLRFLAPLGRMALTNYLMQSLFWTWMFYGHGFGLWGQVPRGLHVLLALAFFAVQIVFSQWWMRRFRFGPAEWLWRSLTYLKLQPMRVQNA